MHQFILSLVLYTIKLIELLPVLHNLFESIFATFCDLKKDDTGQTKAFQVDSNMGIINV